MQELGIQVDSVLQWFEAESDTPYVLIRVDPEIAQGWSTGLRDVIRRAYLSDDYLQDRVSQTEVALGGTAVERQTQIVKSKLPDPSAVMAGDFGEILVYLYQAAEANPRTAFGPKKWRLKEVRTKAAPYSDVVQFVFSNWPNPNEADEIHCAEVKLKSTQSDFNPIEAATQGCAMDRTSRLAKTLIWLKDRAIGESLGAVELAHINRFLQATDNPPFRKIYRAVAVICSTLVDGELGNAPTTTPADYQLVVISVPNLHATYNASYVEALASGPL